MKARPILFSAPMVRALLAGKKTQTRRLVRPEPEPVPDDSPNYKPGAHWWPCRAARSMVETRDMGSFGPYGGKGDRLWVRETFLVGDGMNPENDPTRPTYRADFIDADAIPVKWTPSIYMRRHQSRLTLEVTGVRVERLQAITEDDAKAEGARPFFETFPMFGREQTITSGERCADAEHRAGFAVLWDEINADRATWKSNPFVWVVSFRLLTTARAVATVAP